MARVSFETHRSYLGQPGDPVAWTDQYTLSDSSADDLSGMSGFADYGARIYDIAPPSHIISARGFPTAFARRLRVMMFNLADYCRTLMTEFTAAGGKFQHMEFHAPGDLTRLREKVVINCPGYGARALWGDETVTPVRGQIGWLIPQPEVTYSLVYRGVLMLCITDQPAAVVSRRPPTASRRTRAPPARVTRVQCPRRSEPSRPR